MSFLLYFACVFFPIQMTIAEDLGIPTDSISFAENSIVWPDLIAAAGDSSIWDDSNTLLDATSNHQEPVSIEGSLFPDLLAYCPDGNDVQSRKLKARNSACRNVPNVPLNVPEIPNLLNSIDVPGERPAVLKNEGDLVDLMETAKVYCALGTSDAGLFQIPICGSGNFGDGVRSQPGFYSHVFNSLPSKETSYAFFIYRPCPSLSTNWHSDINVVTPLNLWFCPRTDFFCCMQWIADPPNEFLSNWYAGRGTGLSCENIYDRKWISPVPGYNYDNFKK